MLAAHDGQALERVVRWTARAAELGSIPTRHAAVVLSAYAALLHNWVLPEHFLEWRGYGLFFLIATTAQAFCAGLLLGTNVSVVASMLASGWPDDPDVPEVPEVPDDPEEPDDPLLPPASVPLGVPLSLLEHA